MSRDPIGKRFSYKLISNALGSLMMFAVQILASRGLGVSAYGNFSFVTDFFSKVISFAEMGTSACFYNKLSQNPEDRKIIAFYNGIIIFVVLVLGAVVLLAAGSEAFRQNLWPEISIGVIGGGAVLAFLNWRNQIDIQKSDALGMTTSSERSRVIQRVLLLLLTGLLFLFHRMDLRNFFFVNILSLTAFVVMMHFVLSAYRSKEASVFCLAREDIKTYGHSFYIYTAPLFMLSFVNLLVGISDRWLLQRFGGSIEQGYFSLAYQISTISFLFSMSFTSLLNREFAAAYGQGDQDRMRSLYKKYVPLFYTVTAYFACFLSVQSGFLAVLMGGDSYRGAGSIIFLMALYPLHQTYGQLSGALLYATEQTSLYRNISMSVGVLSIPLTFLMIAPWGFNAGGVGLSVKMIVVQIIAVNIQLYYNARYLKIKASDFLRHQVLSAGVFLGAALLCSAVISGLGAVSFVNFIFTGMAYTVICGVLIWNMPWIAGMERRDITDLLKRIKIIH